jgi:hypothetical protein
MPGNRSTERHAANSNSIVERPVRSSAHVHEDDVLSGPSPHIQMCVVIGEVSLTCEYVSPTSAALCVN